MKYVLTTSSYQTNTKGESCAVGGRGNWGGGGGGNGIPTEYPKRIKKDRKKYTNRHYMGFSAVFRHVSGTLVII